MNNYYLYVICYDGTVSHRYTFPSYDSVMWAFHAMVQGIEVHSLQVVLVSTGEVMTEVEFNNDCCK